MQPLGFRRLAPLALAATILLAPPLGATWSIILVDTRTGEVAIASATCVPDNDLQRLASVVVVGKGAAAAQSYVDTSGRNRLLLFNELGAGTDPGRILQLLAAQDPQHQTRQYGIVDTSGRALGFTGISAGAWAGHVTGRVGSIVYAVQGNVLTGQPVVQAAEQAILNTSGDLATRLMAAMQAAKAMGGDGRCSCMPFNPTGCGSPPASFERTANIGYMIVARQGDADGACNTSVGCASGTYYFNHNVRNRPANGGDPVDELQIFFDYWRIYLRGRPDHHRSTVTLAAPSLPNDGLTTRNATIVLRDVDGLRLPRGGARVDVALDPSSTGSLRIGAVRDNGDGSYTVPLTGGNTAGPVRLRVTADVGDGPILLSPRTELTVTADRLWTDRTSLDVAAGGSIDFLLRGAAQRAYVLLGSASGTSPGLTLAPGVVLPLNPDPFFAVTLQGAFLGTMPSLLGRLDGSGRAEARLSMPRGAYSLPPGLELAFAFALLAPTDFASNPVLVALRR